MYLVTETVSYCCRTVAGSSENKGFGCGGGGGGGRTLSRSVPDPPVDGGRGLHNRCVPGSLRESARPVGPWPCPHIPRRCPQVLLPYLSCAIRGFVQSISLCSSDISMSVQDILRLLTIWFNNGDLEEVAAAVEVGMNNISLEAWLQVLIGGRKGMPLAAPRRPTGFWMGMQGHRPPSPPRLPLSFPFGLVSLCSTVLCRFRPAIAPHACLRGGDSPSPGAHTRRQKAFPAVRPRALVRLCRCRVATLGSAGCPSGPSQVDEFR